MNTLVLLREGCRSELTRMPLFHRCWSQVGIRGGKQQLSLGSGCENKGRALHELMHSLGFLHEQSRQDRDEHVTILYQNIQDGECMTVQYSEAILK